MIDLSTVAGFDWDEGNARKNERHGMSMAEAEQLFFNTPLLVSDDVAHSQSEPRVHALGQAMGGRRLHLCFTLRGDGGLIRVIAARNMSRKEQAVYGQAPQDNP